MSIRAAADTHALLWYLHKDARLSQTALSFFLTTEQAGDRIAVSSITLIETAYLEEKGRVPANSFSRVIQLLNQANSLLQELPVDQAIAQALRQITRSQVPDMPDRIIAATALMLGVPVISRDHKIQTSNLMTIW